LISVLELDRATVLEKWFGSIAATYPRVTATFLVRARDRFANPVGHSISRSIGPIYDQIVADMDEEVLRNALDDVLRVRSVQDFEPSVAVGFIFGLKSAIREAMATTEQASAALAEIDSRIDRVALLAFDIYTGCRERLHEIRANEIRARSLRLLQRAGAGPVAVGHEEAGGDYDD